MRQLGRAIADLRNRLDGQFVIFQLLTQFGFEHFPGSAQWDRVDKHHIIWDLPFGSFAFVKSQQFSAAEVCIRPLDHADHRPFIPLGVCHAYARCHGHARVRHGDVFNVDRADPFATGLDHIFAAVGDFA